MTSTYGSHLRRDERIAVEVKMFLEDRFARLDLETEKHGIRPLMLPGDTYPAHVYAPSLQFQRKLADYRNGTAAAPTGPAPRRSRSPASK